MAAALLTLLAIACGILVSALFSGLWVIGIVLEIVVVAILLAQKSLEITCGLLSSP